MSTEPRIVSAPVFISYSSKDQVIAETICEALEARGHDCWIACRDVHAGENFQEAIVKALRGAEVMCLVFSSNANNSDEIKKELVLAGRHRVTVVPVRVEDVVPGDAFAYEFATRQWIDLFKDWEHEIELLAAQVDHVIETAQPRTPGAAAEARPAGTRLKRFVRRHSREPVVIASAVLCVLVVIGGTVLYMRSFTRALTASVTASVSNAEEAAWQEAVRGGTAASFAAYLKAFPNGAHAEQAQLRIDDLSLAAASGRTNAFDGSWVTTLTCPSGSGGLGFSYQFDASVKDGDYHGHQGTDGEPGWYTLDGKIQPDGSAALFAKGIVSASAYAAGNAPTGAHYAYHVTAVFGAATGSGKREEGRVCTVTFVKQ
jgi:TIR domain